ncbi:MAG: sulfite exporter TauE/SafE family protein [Deltaproteobacteria bacterium]|nr:sulfite exporter TauE/SafE family protein [Deltaproteobacteria bacterium]
MHLTDIDLLFALITLVAALVNGGLGYGFSAITVPLALLLFSNKLLSPALVLVEVFINFVALLVNIRAVPAIWRRMLPMLGGLVPGAVLGTFALAQTGHATLRIATYAVLLPLIVLQTAGVRWPLKREVVAGVPLGAGVGALYAATTISGPPLALLLNNQGYTKENFRAALSLFRIAESILAAGLYGSAGLFTGESIRLSGIAAPGVLIGIPLGFLVLRKLPNETFRRACMGSDALLVSFGLARVLIDQHLVAAVLGYSLVAATVVLEGVLLWRYFKLARAQILAPAEASS